MKSLVQRAEANCSLIAKITRPLQNSYSLSKYSLKHVEDNTSVTLYMFRVELLCK